MFGLDHNSKETQWAFLVPCVNTFDTFIVGLFLIDMLGFVGIWGFLYVFGLLLKKFKTEANYFMDHSIQVGSEVKCHQLLYTFHIGL